MRGKSPIVYQLKERKRKTGKRGGRRSEGTGKSAETRRGRRGAFKGAEKKLVSATVMWKVREDGGRESKGKDARKRR